MPDTSIPRNAQGQTYEEWLAQKVRQSRGNVFQLATDEFIYGMDVAKGISGINSSDLGLIVGHVNKPLAPAITDTTQTAISKYGVISQGLSYGARVINIPVTLMAESNEDYQMRVHQIANALLTTDNNDDISIVFGDEPDVQYYGRFTQLPDFQFISQGAYEASSTFEFTLHDPRGFITVQGQEIELADGTRITAAPNELVPITTDSFTYTPLGTGDAEPIFHVIPKDGINTSRWGFQTDTHNGIWVGEDLADVKIDAKPMQFDDDTTDLSRWSLVEPVDNGNGLYDDNLTFKLDRTGRVTNGKIGLDSNKKQSVELVGDFSDGPMPWGQYYGPVALSQPIGDLTGDYNAADPDKAPSWETEITLTHERYYNRASQQVEAILLDSNGKRRARVGIADGGNDGQAPGAFIFFGQNEAEEATALQSGLGSPWIMPPGGNDGKDITISIPSHTSLTNSFLEYHKITTYVYEYWDGTYKTTRTLKDEEFSYHSNDTNTNTYFRTILSDTTEKHKEQGFLVDWWSYHYGNSNSDKDGNLHVGDLHYWEVGNYIRQNDYAHAPAGKARYTNRTPIKIYINNRTMVTQTFESNSANGTKWTQTTDARYYNGTDPQSGKVGVLYQLSQNVKTAASSGNQKTSTNWIPVNYAFNDKNAHNALDKAVVKFVVGYDTVNKSGYYAEMWLMSDETGTAKPLQSKPFWSMTDPKGMKRDTRYKFKPARVAVWFAKTNLQEDILDPDTNKPAKPYPNDKLNISRIRAYRIKKIPTQADMITLKSGQKGIIDSSDESVVINGTVHNELLDLYSNFPSLRGGIPQTWHFVASGHTIKDFYVYLEYRPTYK